MSAQKSGQTGCLIQSTTGAGEGKFCGEGGAELNSEDCIGFSSAHYQNQEAFKSVRSRERKSAVGNPVNNSL